MNGRLDVSVMLLTYNHKEYIEQAIESILCQKTEYTYEIIIGDDCSTDGTSDIVNKYKEKYPEKIRIVRYKENIGATKVVYLMLKNAKGRYIAQLEGDDYWSSDEKLQKQVQFLESNKNYIGCSHRCLVVDENSNSIETKNQPDKEYFWNYTEEVYALENFCKGSFPGHFNSLVYRNIFAGDMRKAKILYTSHRIIVDRTLALILSLYGNIYRMDEVLSCYRMVEKSDKTNYQSIARFKNLRAEEYKYICKLEEYAISTKGPDINFYEIKKEKLICAVVVLLNDNTKENRKVVFEMLKVSKPKLLYFFIFVLTVMLKIYYRKVLKEDKPVRI